MIRRKQAEPERAPTSKARKPQGHPALRGDMDAPRDQAVLLTGPQPGRRLGGARAPAGARGAGPGQRRPARQRDRLPRAPRHHRAVPPRGAARLDRRARPLRPVLRPREDRGLGGPRPARAGRPRRTTTARHRDLLRWRPPRRSPARATCWRRPGCRRATSASTASPTCPAASPTSTSPSTASPSGGPGPASPGTSATTPPARRARSRCSRPSSSCPARPTWSGSARRPTRSPVPPSSSTRSRSRSSTRSGSGRSRSGWTGSGPGSTPGSSAPGALRSRWSPERSGPSSSRTTWGSAAASCTSRSCCAGCTAAASRPRS